MEEQLRPEGRQGHSNGAATARPASGDVAMRVQMRALAASGHDVQRAALEPGAASKGGSLGGPIQFAKKTGKERGSDIPSWAKGAELEPGETPEQGATSLCDQQYGAGNSMRGRGRPSDRSWSRARRSRALGAAQVL